MQLPVTHELSRKLLLGDSPSVADIDRRSAERHVDPHTPPSFVVHAFDDAAVPVENSLRYVHAMREAKRPVEAHLLQEGGHAFGVGVPHTSSGSWTSLFMTWLERNR
jgi:dipeptidyl aminopeptidase/acylaminoacyl peptidase